MPKLSTHPCLPYLSSLCSLIFLAFGATYILSPRTGYTLYGFSSGPATPSDWAIMERIMVLYGAKDVFVGVAIACTTWVGTRKSAGVVLVAAGLCAGVDGWVVQSEAGRGAWNHWGYGSLMGVLGCVVGGVLG
ncbi:hypothetical protein B5807_06632 [Epicoccum nigrum]|uniref:Integral membrane protein n=1 Tax=Epicoccum nigrum TaxID=105696 RepID=A0A1Y2LX08_EPING|nr:hypothetical protein B5807_06632 [Epicoccum nigrum]